ncbi:MAG: ParB/RepB/Spo0J family partition protein [Pseudomonadota bacterium]
MNLEHIDITQLKPSSLNVRKHGAKDGTKPGGALVESIRTMGLLQPLLVRPNCEGYEVVAGQRRYHACKTLVDEGAFDASVPCLVMEAGEDARAIEASLTENVARLPMDEIDQYKAFAALKKEGLAVEEIASRFGVTERLVAERLALANLIVPILTAYRNTEIDAATVRLLTMASKAKQKDWIDLHRSPDKRAPIGRALKGWLLGGAAIPVDHAHFDVAACGLATIGDLFGEEDYIADSEAFWPVQSAAVAEIAEAYRAKGWETVVVHDIGAAWNSWRYEQVGKADGGEVHITSHHDGEVTEHVGVLDREIVRKRERAAARGDTAPPKPEITKAMQCYLDLHRHTAVRHDLLGHPGIALRLAVSQMIAGSALWSIKAEAQKAPSEAIGESLAANKAESAFAKERAALCDLLGIGDDSTIVPHKDDWTATHDLHAIFAKLVALDDETVLRILTFVTAETLACGSAIVEALGVRLGTDMGAHWQADDCFFDLLRDKEAINAMLREVGGKRVADGNAAETAKTQKSIIRDCLKGVRKGVEADWQPRYMAFPMRAYTKRGGVRAVEDWKAVKAHHG